MYSFMMPYATKSPWVLDPPRSAFVDGEIALMLASRALLARHPGYETELHHRTEELRARMEKSPVLSAESYPDECWTFCTTLALAAMRVEDTVRGEQRGAAFARRWLDVAREKLVDPTSGLLVSSFTQAGRHLDGPEGSSIFLAAHALLLVDPAFARDQYQRARRELGGRFLGFGWAREWPRSWAGPTDVDSGPIVPVVEASAGASGFFFLGATAFEDDTSLAELVTSLDFAAFPVRKGETLRYAASNQVGDATLLYALGFGPLWARVMKGGCAVSRRPALLGALIAVAVLLVCHALGMREDVSVLSGTASATGAESALLGVIYVLAWFAALVVAPILTLGALFDFVLERCAARTRPWTSRLHLDGGRRRCPGAEDAPGPDH
jgi:hypothetical protein